MAKRRFKRHVLQAAVVDGQLIIHDRQGRQIPCKIKGSTDNLMLACHVTRVGWVGGWSVKGPAQVRAIPWPDALLKLKNAVNSGIVYPRLEDLPG